MIIGISEETMNLIVQGLEDAIELIREKESLASQNNIWSQEKMYIEKRVKYENILDEVNNIKNI